MADKPPPSRYSVVERGGRLVVVDRETGQVPPTAAERMAEHDRRMGNDPVRPAPRTAPKTAASVTAPAPAKRPETPPRKPKDRVAAAVAERNRKQPWQNGPQRPGATPPPREKAAPGSQRATIVTSKWWDAKGPRTIELGPKGKQILTSGFVTLLVAAAVAVALLLLISPIALFVAAFLLFRWGGGLLGPFGASIVDKALAEKG